MKYYVLNMNVSKHIYIINAMSIVSKIKLKNIFDTMVFDIYFMNCVKREQLIRFNCKPKAFFESCLYARSSCED